jgi:hypothetical protein
MGTKVTEKVVLGGRKKYWGSVYVRGMKTGLGSHSRPVKMFAPRS